jgi:rhodanese-related sulfurtransferase
MNLPSPLKALVTVAFGLIASVALAQSSGAPANARDEAKTPVLSRAQFDQLLARPDQLLVIDVRRPDEVTAIGGLPVYLSIQLDNLEQSVAWIPKDRKIVTVSNHAGRAGRAADLLAAKGFNVVGRIGVQTYEEQGGKLTRIAPKAPAGAEPQKTAHATSAKAK